MVCVRAGRGRSVCCSAGGKEVGGGDGVVRGDAEEERKGRGGG